MTQYQAETNQQVWVPTQQDRNLGMLVWALNFFFPIIAPLIFLLTQDSPFLKAISRESLNFSISYTVYGSLPVRSSSSL